MSMTSLSSPSLSSFPSPFSFVWFEADWSHKTLSWASFRLKWLNFLEPSFQKERQTQLAAYFSISLYGDTDKIVELLYLPPPSLPPLTQFCLVFGRTEVSLGEFWWQSSIDKGRGGKICCGMWFSRSKFSFIPRSLNSFVWFVDIYSLINIRKDIIKDNNKNNIPIIVILETVTCRACGLMTRFARDVIAAMLMVINKRFLIECLPFTRNPEISVGL